MVLAAKAFGLGKAACLLAAMADERDPLRLRDVDGFLLIPDTFPDRAMMARQSGVVHTSASYALDRFSPAEWSSEERERYLAEYSRDAETARAQLQRLDGKGAIQAGDHHVPLLGRQAAIDDQEIAAMDTHPLHTLPLGT